MSKSSKDRQNEAIAFLNSSDISCANNISSLKSPSVDFFEKCKIHAVSNFSGDEWNNLLSLRHYTFRKMIGLFRWERIAHEIILNTLTRHPSIQTRNNAVHFLIKQSNLLCRKLNRVYVASELTEHLSKKVDIRHDILIKFYGGELSVEIKLNGNVEKNQYEKYRHWQSLDRKKRNVIILKPDIFYEKSNYKNNATKQWLHFIECSEFVDFILKMEKSTKDNNFNKREWTSEEYELFNMLLEGVGAI